MIGGFLLIDKPAGMTSRDVVNRVVKLTGIRKTGHSGTLDPFATGLLLIGCGKALKLFQYLENLPKTYIARLKLGQATETYDPEGEITATQPVPRLTRENIDAVLESFQGVLEQTPPAYSAVRVNGQRAYKLARKGQSVKLKSRQVHIFDIKLHSFDESSLCFETTCSAGTYIRSLAVEIAAAMGTCGHLVELRRTAIGHFHLNRAQTLDALEEKMNDKINQLTPIEKGVQHLQALTLDNSQLKELNQGRRIKIKPKKSGCLDTEQYVAIFSTEQLLIGIASVRQISVEAQEKIEVIPKRILRTV